jgi:predicted GNAT superfamily acetyltransferase
LNDFQKAESLIISALAPMPDISPAIYPLALVEIPFDFLELKTKIPTKALEWRMYTRTVFEELFARGYIITDFIHTKSDDPPRSYYVLSHGEATF